MLPMLNTIQRRTHMRDTTKELNQAMDNLKHYQRTPVLMNGVMATLVVCIPALTISTILWQWLG